MFNIEEDQLKLLLEKKRKIIERKKYDGIGEIISAISLMITLVLSDFSHLEVIKPGYFKFGAWSIAWIILIYGTYEFIQSLKGYSIEQLYCEIMDLDPKIEHPFDIIIIRNSTCGKYLVFKSKRKFFLILLHKIPPFLFFPVNIADIPFKASFSHRLRKINA